MSQPSTDWKEIVPPGEAEAFERLAEHLRALQRRRGKKAGVGRALHRKGQLGAIGELTVLPDLPAHARVGLFATPATFHCYVRFSNGGGERLPDKKPDVRGVALKLLGVPGRKVIPGLEDATTQDFLLIQSASTPFRDADEFVWFVVAAARPALLLPRALVRLGPVRAVRVIRQLLAGISRPVASLATSRYWSALPIRFGKHAVKYALVPRGAAEPEAPVADGPDRLGRELAARLARGPVEYDFQVQFFVDEARTPIESSTQEWLESDAPFVTVARLTLPRQDVDGPRGQRVAEAIEGMSFDPWHAGEDFRPLGSMMRARNAAYRLSTQERGATAEPTGATPIE